MKFNEINEIASDFLFETSVLYIRNMKIDTNLRNVLKI